jgi:hypothetical protein
MSKRVRKPLTDEQREAKRERDRRYRAAKKAAKAKAAKKEAPKTEKPSKVKVSGLMMKVKLGKKEKPLDIKDHRMFAAYLAFVALVDFIKKTI